MQEGPENPKKKLIAEDESQAAHLILGLVTGGITEDEVEGVMVYSSTTFDVVEADEDEDGQVGST